MTTVEQPTPRCLGQMVTTDAMFGAAGKVSRDWGDHGYVLGVHATSGYGGAIFAVRCSDGSEFFIHSDRYGNAHQVDWDGSQWVARENDA